MMTIRIRKKIDSETVHLPELRPFIGKTVEIVVAEEGESTASAYDAFFSLAGHDVVDPDAYKVLRAASSR